MSCYLLTGTTGLLGAYLLKDFSQAGTSLAVVVRPTRMASAERRVEKILKHWSAQGIQLTPPTVFAGDITQPQLGLSSDAQDWIASNCTGIIHSAASLKFRETRGEPWTTNLNGTTNMVRLAEKLAVPEFHYISTAYVCGSVDHPAYELPVPRDVRPRNVYEESKGQAERRVLEADLPQPATVLRPSIIIGDSETGYTSTFHGVYLPLRQAAALLAGIGSFGGATPVLDPKKILRMMGLTGRESKNLVPVDWVSRMISKIVLRPDLHGNIFHITAQQPTSVELLTRATVRCILQALGLEMDALSGLDDVNTQEFDQAFCSMLSVYKEYWADDPKFDQAGLSLVAGDDPCPVVTEEMLLTTFQFALDEMVKKPDLLQAVD